MLVQSDVGLLSLYLHIPSGVNGFWKKLGIFIREEMNSVPLLAPSFLGVGVGGWGEEDEFYLCFGT